MLFLALYDKAEPGLIGAQSDKELSDVQAGVDIMETEKLIIYDDMEYLKNEAFKSQVEEDIFYEPFTMSEEDVTTYDERIVVGGSSTASNPYELIEGKTYTAAPYNGNGGAVEVQTDGIITGTDITFADNSVSGYGKSGGAIYNSGQLSLAGATFTSNMSQTNGGAVLNEGSADITGNALFSGNTATFLGGAFNNGVNCTANFAKVTFDSNTASKDGGALYLTGGSVTMEEATFTGNQATGNGGAAYNSKEGTITFNNVTFADNTASSSGGALYTRAAVTFEGKASFTGNTASMMGGALANNIGSVTLAGDAVFTGNTASMMGGALFNTGTVNFTGSNITFSNNTASGGNGGGAIYNTGTVTIGGEATFTGNSATNGGAINNTGTVSICGRVILATSTDTFVNNGMLDWNVTSGSAEKTDFAISDWSLVSGKGRCSLTVGSFEEQYCATYTLAENVDSFTGTITVKDSLNTKLGMLSLESSCSTSDNAYSLALNDNILTLTITAIVPEMPHGLSSDEEGITWQSSADAFDVQYSKDNFSSILKLQTETSGVNTYGLPENIYDWQVKMVENTNWSKGEAIVSEYEQVEPFAWESKNNGYTDIFFANASGTWSRGYIAQNAGLLGGWKGTRETVSLSGKNRLADTFMGSNDASILVLTDDINGDVLFVDDIYTAFPAEHQARIAQIDEIRAGAGDDIVDLTSQRYEYFGEGVLVRGGSGNDTIWANKGENKLFGDAGNDRLVGSAGNDVLAGGIGDDSLNGGGGDDIFCFCDNWGSDIVEQLSNGSVTLWFNSGSEDNWNQATMTYTDGGNTVKVSGVSDVTLIFGNNETEQYSVLASIGCFLEESSEKIFEDSGKEMLA